MQRLDHKEIFCPMSLQTMRHPVKVSSGYYYELEMLVQSIQISEKTTCPLTRNEITSVFYDKKLKERLDVDYLHDSSRYPDYPIDELLTELDKMIYPFKNAASSAFYMGTMSGLSTYHFLSNLFRNETVTHQDQINYSLIFSTAVAAVDFTCLYFSRNKFGIFGGIQRIGERVATAIANDHPNEELNGMMNAVLLSSI